MKEAMWKVDPKVEFKFPDATDPNQLVNVMISTVSRFFHALI
jgi:hypothetical protein